MTQNEKILNHLKAHGSITPIEALSEYGIMRLASRISDLKNGGVCIRREIMSTKNRLGETVRFARYYIAEKKE